MRSVWLAIVCCSSALAAPVPTVRIGTLVPDGSAWARELKAFGRDVEGLIKVKVYYGGIAGDEHEMIDRVRRGQLDGIAGTTACMDLAPSLRVSRVLGLFSDTDQAARLVRALPHVDEEFRANGFFNLATSGMGPSIIFTRTPARTWAELKKLRLWRWDLDPIGWRQARAMGLDVVPLPLEKAIPAFDEGKVDGFISLAASSLAFQFHSRAPYVLPLDVDYLSACLLLSVRAWDALPNDARDQLKTAAAKLQHRMELVGQQLDHTVMSGALIGRGITVTPVSTELRKQFHALALSTRADVVALKLVPQPLLAWVEQWLRNNRPKSRLP